ncbi:MAG: Hint domain-containing protein [Pseudomonadota bacterium]
MSMQREAGCFAVSWSQTEIDGVRDAPAAMLQRGACWRWWGDALRLDAATGLLNARSAEVIQRHAIRRLMGDRASFDRPLRTFKLTEGPRAWGVRMVSPPRQPGPLLLFGGTPPPSGVELHVGPDEGVLPTTKGAAVGLAEGALVETTRGAKPVEWLSAGDMILTAEGGAEELVWVGARRVSRARMMVEPGLYPVRIRASRAHRRDLLVAADQCVALQGKGAEGPFVAARHAAQGRAGYVDYSLPTLTYYSLMLARRGSLLANGFAVESYDPDRADLSTVARDQLLRMFDVIPGLAANVPEPRADGQQTSGSF